MIVLLVVISSGLILAGIIYLVIKRRKPLCQLPMTTRTISTAFNSGGGPNVYLQGSGDPRSRR